MRTIRIGMVGAGVHATTILLPSLNYVPHIERVAICDLNVNLARSRAEQFGFKSFYTDYKRRSVIMHGVATFLYGKIQSQNLPLVLLRV